MNSCPYVAGPACTDCDGACWLPMQPAEPQPSPCEWCSRWNGVMQDCDGTCETITEDQWKHHFFMGGPE